MTEELKGDQPESSKGDGLKQVGGKWYLAFTWYDEYEKSDQREEVELKATTEKEAIAEAETMKKAGKRAHGVSEFTGKEMGHEIPANYEVIYKARTVRVAVDKTLGGADR